MAVTLNTEEPESGGPCLPTPPSVLREQIMSACVPKNEREWWAHNEIERLVSEIEQQRELLDDFVRLTKKADEFSGRYLGVVWHVDAASALARAGRQK